MKYGCDAIYLESECSTNCNNHCGSSPFHSNPHPNPHSVSTESPRCPTDCELEELARCAALNPLVSDLFECVDPIATLRSAWFLISCLSWCSKCADPGNLLILAAAHLSALSQLQRAGSTAQLNAAMKGAINQAIVSDPNHWNLTIPGKLFLQHRPKSIGIAGAAIY